MSGRQTVFVIGGFAIIAACLGCSSRPSAVKPPDYDPEAFADSLLQRCDADGSGSLTKKEAELAPGLVARWSRYDADEDGAISREELELHAQQWVERGDGLASITCVVRLKQRQIGDVTVKLIPDESLEGVVHPAETVSLPKHSSFLSIPSEHKPEALRKLAGMQYGLFTVEVSHPRMKLVPAANCRGLDVGPSDQASAIKIDVEQQ